MLTYDIGRIIDDDRIGIERPFTNDWNLLIHDVKYEDAGKYVCQINTKPVKTKTVMLHVLGISDITFFVLCKIVSMCNLLQRI